VSLCSGVIASRSSAAEAVNSFGKGGEMAIKQSFRIFVGSPADMAPERAVANDVIGRLRHEYRGVVDLEAQLYEYLPLPANEPPQRNIPDPAEADVAIFLFWHSVGYQQLSDEFPLSDGSSAESGTLWEFDRACSGVKRGDIIRRPLILAYKKTDPHDSIRSDEDWGRAGRGFAAIKAFKEKYIKDDVFKGAWTEYEKNALHEILHKHLRDWLLKQIPTEVSAHSDIPVWTRGVSPFPGLSSFDKDYASVFYGRTEETFSICRRVEEFERAGTPPILVITGASGVGKSSLLKAGVLPEMERRAKAQGQQFRFAVCRPSESGIGALQSLAEALCMADGLPELLALAEFDPRQFAEHLRSNLDAAAVRISEAKKAAESSLPSTPAGKPLNVGLSLEKGLAATSMPPMPLSLVIIVDQFEELFAAGSMGANQAEQNATSVSEVSAFAAALQMLAARFGFVALGSMRDDFLPSLNVTPELKSVALDGIVSIGPVASSAVHKVIEYPALAAGLKFERIAESNQSLADVISDEAIQLGPNSLPLLQFVMQSLAECAHSKDGDQRNLMRLKDYEALGRVKGVLRKTASSAFNSLSYTDRAEAKRLFLDLTACGTGASEKATAKIKEYELEQHSPAFKRCVDHFVRARLLVRARSSAPDTIRLYIAHEALLNEWIDLEEWVQQNKDKVVLDTLVEDQANRWDDRGRKPEYLILSKDELHAAEDLIRIEKPVKRDSVVDRYISGCTRKSKWRRLTAVSVLLIFFAWGLTNSLRDIQFQSVEETKNILLGSSVVIPYIFVRLVGKWLAMTNAVQRQWRSLYWACVFLLSYLLWGRHQVGDAEGLHYWWMIFYYAWTLLFPATYHMVVAGVGPLTLSEHKLRRKRWWRVYIPIPVALLFGLRLISLLPSSPFRAILELMVAAGVVWLSRKLSGWAHWMLEHPSVRQVLNAIRNGYAWVFARLTEIWRRLGTVLSWLTPPTAMIFSIYLAGPTVWGAFDQNQQKTSISASPVAATFFLPTIARFSSDDSRDSRAWWRAVMDPTRNTVVAMAAAPSEGECDLQGHPDALWGHLRRLGLTEGGLAIKGGCKVARTFEGDRMNEELVYNDIEKPLLRRVPRDGGFDIDLANDDGSMSRRGRLVQLTEEGGEVRWLYTTVAATRSQSPAGAAVGSEPTGDRRLWTYSSSADRFRVMRVDEAMRPIRFGAEAFSTLEIARDKAGRLATLRFLDPSGNAAADANGVHRYEFSYGAREQCKTAVAVRTDGSELSRKSCRDTRFEWLAVED
jgi:hypothetical protein